MNPLSDELREKIRQQFDMEPYPNVPLEHRPGQNIETLYLHDIRTAFHVRNQQICQTEGAVILDAGCGSGYKSLVLATANPGARIIGIDLSEKSVNLARDRLRYHGYEQAEFYAMGIDELPQLGIEFDYINCDEVLYLTPDIAQTLQVFKSVLKPAGIIRANLHSAIQRSLSFRSQQLFRLMGLMDGNPSELEMGIVKETFESLEDWVEVKRRTWNVHRERMIKAGVEEPFDAEYILMNYLFQGDTGYTIADMFTALEVADLEFISMVEWTQWSLLDLFKDADDLPTFWALSFPELPIALQLQLKELLHANHRLLDFWCGHPGQRHPATAIAEWSETDWNTATVQLHPQLQMPKVREDLLQAIATLEPFTISQYVPALQRKQSVFLKYPLSACLLLLWEGPQSVPALTQRWLQIQPCDWVTLESVDPAQAWQEITGMLASLADYRYVLIESASNPV